MAVALDAHPRARRCVDESAELFLVAYDALDDLARIEVAARVGARVGRPKKKSTRHQKATRAALAVWDARDILGRPPSVEEYRELARDPRYADCDWPDDTFIRRWLGGSWPAALESLGLEAPSQIDFVVAPLGAAFTEDEVLAALRECHADIRAVPTSSSYPAWARRRDVRSRSGRRPFSLQPVYRLYGGLFDALIAAGILEPGDDQGFAIAGGRALRAASYRISDERLDAGVREVADRLGRSPRPDDYKRERLRIFDETGRVIAAYATLNKRFRGEWDGVLVRAGCEPLGGRTTAAVPRGPYGPQMSDFEIVQTVQDAYREKGAPFTADVYNEWRLDERKRDPSRRTPASGTLRLRLGGWARVRAIACGAESL